jgi:hypothetical protein
MPYYRLNCSRRFGAKVRKKSDSTKCFRFFFIIHVFVDVFGVVRVFQLIVAQINNNTDFMVFIWKISHLFVSLSPDRITNKNDNYNEEIIDYYLRGLGLGADGIG